MLLLFPASNVLAGETELRLGGSVVDGGWRNGGLDEECLLLSLRVDDQVYSSIGKSGWFEDELLELQKVLPNGTYLKACINWGLSDYWPGGNPAFGGMLCFRDSKAQYRKVKSKSDLFKLAEAIKPLIVQETFLCPEFKKRQPGTGYRGWTSQLPGRANRKQSRNGVRGDSGAMPQRLAAEDDSAQKGHP
jgi:hypothetical protein